MLGSVTQSRHRGAWRTVTETLSKDSEGVRGTNTLRPYFPLFSYPTSDFFG